MEYKTYYITKFWQSKGIIGISAARISSNVILHKIENTNATNSLIHYRNKEWFETYNEAKEYCENQKQRLIIILQNKIERLKQREIK